VRQTLTFLLLVAIAHPAVADDRAGVDFFEKSIRPILVEHCYSCHSAEAAAQKKLRGGLSLDTRSGVRTGGDSGPAIDEKSPRDSLLIKSILHDGDLKMPPRGKLKDAEIEAMRKWVLMGAPDPRTDAASVKKQVGLSIEEGRKFWSFVPPVTPALPPVRDASWPIDPLDQFILNRIEAKGLSPNPPADRMTLARRVSFALTGLPPAPDEADRFISDPATDAYARYVDRLMASPAFGERWGRHWLDVARYAESVTLRGFVYKDAWRYRDYVIDSFHRDVPFDRLIREQIAGDLLPASGAIERERQIVATTYLMLGNTNLEEQDKKQLRMDVVDEQIDVISKGLLAQTVSCARCHDHKFDPIPTRDYYSLAGILRNVKVMEHANVSAWTEVPLPVPGEMEAKLKAKEAKIAELQAQIKSAKAKANKGQGSGVLKVAQVPGIAVDDSQARKVGAWQVSQHSGHYIGEGYVHDQNGDKGNKTITFTPALPADGKYEVRLAYSPGGNRAEKVPVTVFGAEGEKEIFVNMKATPPIDGRFISLGTFQFEKAGQSFVIVSNLGTSGHVTPDCVTFIPEGTKTTTDAGAAKANVNPGLAAMEAELKKLIDSGPIRPKAMAPLEEKTIEETHVHIRGSVHTLGEAAPRGFLRVAGGSATMPKEQSGRVQLANWIASPENPLTARVIVNRTWHWLFGSGLVRTVDNFGVTGETPSHPELLDFLATEFVKNGWSIKTLVRRIVLSRTYQQSSAIPMGNPDPENRLWARFQRTRLEAEAIRDSMLVASGTLDPRRGGPGFPASQSADYGFVAKDHRRSVYLPMFRNAMPDLLETFDPADHSMVTGKRNASTVAPQALVMLNHPFVMEQASSIAKRLRDEKRDTADAISRAYRIVLGRLPMDGERNVALNYIQKTGDWTGLIHSLLASADFRFVD
jgi:cytochrome c553